MIESRLRSRGTNDGGAGAASADAIEKQQKMAENQRRLMEKKREEHERTLARAAMAAFDEAGGDKAEVGSDALMP